MDLHCSSTDHHMTDHCAIGLVAGGPLPAHLPAYTALMLSPQPATRMTSAGHACTYTCAPARPPASMRRMSAFTRAQLPVRRSRHMRACSASMRPTRLAALCTRCTSSAAHATLLLLLLLRAHNTLFISELAAQQHRLPPHLQSGAASKKAAAAGAPKRKAAAGGGAAGSTAAACDSLMTGDGDEEAGGSSSGDDSVAGGRGEARAQQARARQQSAEQRAQRAAKRRAPGAPEAGGVGAGAAGAATAAVPATAAAAGAATTAIDHPPGTPTPRPARTGAVVAGWTVRPEAPPVPNRKAGRRRRCSSSSGDAGQPQPGQQGTAAAPDPGVAVMESCQQLWPSSAGTAHQPAALQHDLGVLGDGRSQCWLPGGATGAGHI
jgi:hypothetical protein